MDYLLGLVAANSSAMHVSGKNEARIGGEIY
jgi:hypothetical protein